jgi:predicted ABC-type ATPase
MRSLAEAVKDVLKAQTRSGKPLSIVLAGHNGSGKSTLWYNRLAPTIKIPLVNADRMMLSVLPEVGEGKKLPSWASNLRDTDTSWMQVAQKGVEAFVAQAMAHKVAFAMETVFSHWIELSDGRIASKIDLIRQMQENGYFVVLFFVGLTSASLSMARVSTRVQQGGHAVDPARLVARFPRTQRAIGHALHVADAAILLDNSRDLDEAFTVCRVQLQDKIAYDLRDGESEVPIPIRAWLDVVCPQNREAAAEQNDASPGS